MEIDKNLAKKILAINLTRYIREKSFTQKRLADDIGMSPQQLSFYCLGKRLPSDDNLQKIADGLGITHPKELYRMPDGMVPKAQQKAWNALIDLMSISDEEDLSKVTEYIQLLIDARKNKPEKKSLTS